MKNKIRRRDFLKTAAKGGILCSSAGSLLAFAAPEEVRAVSPVKSGDREEPLLSGWDIGFEEENSVLHISNGPVSVQGELTFTSGGAPWKADISRDGIKWRNTLIDTQENVQGYWVCNQSGNRLEILFYHRTAQAFTGNISFQGEITFPAGGFCCKTRPSRHERVLPLHHGQADSLLNDSVFSPQDDILLQLNASALVLKTTGDGRFSFRMSGAIEEASEAVFTINLKPDYFRNSYVPYYAPIDRTRCPKAPTGWMSWNTYFDTATAENNLEEARLGKKYFQPFGCEFWSIESWQGNSDKLPVSGFYNMNLEVNEKQFPDGMKKLADDIRALGFRPGIWTAPFGTGNKAFYEKHKNWFLHDKTGKPVSSWNGRYTLDPTVGEAREHLKKIHHTASREWGYEFFKIDGMSGRNHGYCAHLYERPEIRECFSDPSCPNPFELCVQAFREGIGEDRVFLACQGHTSGPEARYADASRIGADIVHPNQPVEWSGVANQGRCLINQVFTHNIVMVADPDTLLVRDLPLEEARTSATIVALPGQLTFFGDKLSGLEPAKIRLLQQTLPVADVLPGSLYPYFRMLPVWNLAVKHILLGEYNIIALFNWEDEKRTISATAEELGIAEGDYTGFEFWTEKAVEYDTVKNELAMEVPAHGVRLVALHPVKGFPQWLSSDRHIAQTGIELSAFDWIGEEKSVKGAIRLIGGFPLTMRVRVPREYSFSSIDCKGASCETKLEKEVLSVTFLSKKTKDAGFTLRFGN